MSEIIADKNQPQTDELLSELHRGEGYAYYWCGGNKQTLWYPIGQWPPIPASWEGMDIYFGIHPAGASRGSN